MRNIQYDNRSDWVDLSGFVQVMSADNQDRMAEIQACLGKALREDVTPRQQQVLFLYYVQGLNMRQIAEALGVERSTVSRTLKRGEERIRRRMRYNGGDLIRAKKGRRTRH